MNNSIDPGPSVDRNIFAMSQREKRRLKIDQLPANLGEAIGFLRKDKVVQTAMGEHIFEQYCEAKESEWAEYIAHVSNWEVQRYLTSY